MKAWRKAPPAAFNTLSLFEETDYEYPETKEASLSHRLM